MGIQLRPAYIFDCPNCGQSTAETAKLVGSDGLDPQFSRELREAVGETSSPVFLRPSAVKCFHCDSVHRVDN